VLVFLVNVIFTRAAASACSRRPVGRAHARVDDLVAAARVQLRGDPRRRAPLDEFWHRKYPKDVFDIPYTSVSSFVLLFSSLTMVLALSAAQRRDAVRMRLWLLTTALLGMTFVAGQVYEFTSFYKEGLHIDTNLFGTTFFVLTGFHGVHVTVGILMLLSLTGMSLGDRLPDDPAFPVEMVGLYWHFVDIVWIVIFTVVYLIPTGSGPK
jgi:heme/copper-type cytochrome/quinol oxidase subunit 3